MTRYVSGESCAPTTAVIERPIVHFNSVYLWTISLVAALGGLLFGYDWVVIGGAKPFYEKYFHLTNASQQGWAVSCALIGCLFGAMISGTLCDKYGRKLLLLLSALLFAVSSLAIAMTSVFHTFVAWRIAGGIAIGLASNLSPMYIAEIAPAQVRGKLVSVNQLTIVIGILLAQFMNWIIAKPVPTGASALEILNSWNGQTGWRWMFGVTACLPCCFFWACCRYPRAHDGSRNRAAGESQGILQRLGGEAYATQTLAEIKATLSVNTNASLRQLLDPKLAGVLLLGIRWLCFNSGAASMSFSTMQPMSSRQRDTTSPTSCSILLSPAQ